MGKKKKPDIPIFNESLIETHCHLDYLKEHSFEHTISECKRVNIEKVMTISVSPDNLQTVRDLTTKDPIIYGTQGIHPHQAMTYNDDVHQEIDDHLTLEKIVAVGEIGLDYYYNKSPQEVQIEAFKRQLTLAQKHDLPVVIHSRDADEDMIKILTDYAPELKRKGVIHSFTSGPELAQCALSLGFCLGFNGIITFKNAQNVRDVLSQTPLEKIIVETDSPFLTPVPYRGVENHPFYLPFVAQYIAQERNLEPSFVAKQTSINAKQLFKFTV